jgi:mannose-6-phosphate isomerase-like protein (cupin superfamily)
MRTPSDDWLTIKADSGDTGNLLSILELQSEPMRGPAMHIHHREDEVWYVLEGEFRFMVGGEPYRLSTGGMAFGPRGAPHCFQNIGDGPGRLLAIYTPAGAERLFEEFAAKQGSLPDPADPAFLTELAHRYGIDFVGPPLAVSHPL